MKKSSTKRILSSKWKSHSNPIQNQERNAPSSRQESSGSQYPCFHWWWRRWWESEHIRTASCICTPLWHRWWDSQHGWERCGSPRWSYESRTKRRSWASAFQTHPWWAGSQGWDAWNCGWACLVDPQPRSSWPWLWSWHRRGCPWSRRTRWSSLSDGVMEIGGREGESKTLG